MHKLACLPALLVLGASILGCQPGSVAELDDEGTTDLGKADDPASDPAGCRFDAADAFEPRERIPRGKYKGRCYDTRQARPVQRLDASSAAAYGGAFAGELTLANVFHDGRFWVAHVPLDGVEVVLFQLEYFPAIVPAGHTQMRVRFREDAPVVLDAQSPSDAGETAIVRDLVFSVEAIGQVGYKYDIVRGVLDDFGAVYRVTSLSAKLEHMIVRQGHEVEQWPLELAPGESQRLLESFAQESDTRNMQYMYNTLFLNCTNEAVRVIDLSVDYSALEQIARFVAKVTEFYPNVIRTALVARGLLPLDQSTDWPRLAADPTVADLLDELRNR